MIKVEIKEEFIDDDYPPSSVIPDDNIERCGNCVACFRVTNCGKCPNCAQRIQPCVRRICIRNGTNTDSYLPNEPSLSTIVISKDEPDFFADLLPNSPEPIVKKIRKPYTKRIKEPTVKRAKIAVDKDSELEMDSETVEETESDEDDMQTINRRPHKVHKPHVWKPKEIRARKRNDDDENYPQRQCYGPTCVKAAQHGSKYCSLDCGYKLAEHRLKYILQSRVQDFYKIPSTAESNDDKKILMLNLKKAAVERKYEAANSFAYTLDTYLFQLSNLRSNNAEFDVPSIEKSNLNILMICLLCNADLKLDTYQTHMNTCTARIQRRFHFCSEYALAKNPHDIVCNKYIPSAQSYCRRLRFACTEHNKSCAQLQICGYPFKLATRNGSSRIEELFSLELNDLVAEGICNEKHKTCHLHPSWEANLRALLDNHRMNLLLCLDEISIEYHRVQETYRTRGDALTLLTNWRRLSNETLQKEEIEFRVIQMTALNNPGTDYLVLKQE